MSKRVISYVLVTGVVILFLGFVSYLSFSTSNQVTDYFRYCKDKTTDLQNCKTWSIDSTTYLLDKTSNKVMWYNGSGDSERINCHISDKSNWWCDAYKGTALEGNGQNVIGFAGGKSIENTPAYKTSTTQHFGVLKYLLYKFFSF